MGGLNTYLLIKTKNVLNGRHMYSMWPYWRNWIARMTSNHKVAGSSPA